MPVIDVKLFTNGKNRALQSHVRPPTPATALFYALTLNQRVVGSSPTRLTTQERHWEAIGESVGRFIIVKSKNS